MATVRFMTFNDDEGQFLGSANLARVPVKGERVILRGKEFGDTQDSATMFKVHSVEWEVDLDEEEASVDVWLRLPSNETCFIPRCFCPKEKQVIDVPGWTGHVDGRCDDCRMRIVARDF